MYLATSGLHCSMSTRMQPVGSISGPGIELGPLHWEHRVLATGAQSLSHWITREIHLPYFKEKHLNFIF